MDLQITRTCENMKMEASVPLDEQLVLTCSHCEVVIVEVRSRLKSPQKKASRKVRIRKRYTKKCSVDPITVNSCPHVPTMLAGAIIGEVGTAYDNT